MKGYIIPLTAVGRYMGQFIRGPLEVDPCYIPMDGEVSLLFAQYMRGIMKTSDEIRQF